LNQRGNPLKYRHLHPLIVQSIGGLITRGGNMKSFWTGTIAAVIISVVAGFALNASNKTVGEKYSTSNVRLH
tara:strand:+ start:1172 stop:1387 length:216 start_codon:yes stop_codon:yes gene_type:complete